MMHKAYTVVIGNALPKFNKYRFPKLDAYWEVDNILPENHSEFPPVSIFPRNISHKFSIVECAGRVGIWPFFNSVLESACLDIKRVAIGITKEDANMVSDALKVYVNSVPLYSEYDQNTYDENLAVLQWLEWWMQWAVKNCETPAIQAY
jgi:hypothetical protein